MRKRLTGLRLAWLECGCCRWIDSRKAVGYDANCAAHGYCRVMEYARTTTAEPATEADQSVLCLDLSEQHPPF